MKKKIILTLYLILLTSVIILAERNVEFTSNSSGKIIDYVEINYNFPNLLDFKGFPDSLNDRKEFFFSDLGAWTGFSLPADSAKDDYGFFGGPFLSDENRWFSEKLFGFELINNGTQKKYILSEAGKREITTYPGLLEQNYEFTDLNIKIRLYYVSTNKTAIDLLLKNNSDKDISITLNGIVNSTARYDKYSEYYELHQNNNYILTYAPFQHESALLEITEKESSSLATIKNISIPPKEEKIFSSYIFYGDKNSTDFLDFLHHDANDYYNKNRERWNGYLQEAIRANKNYSDLPQYHPIVVKAVMTLVNNWKAPYGDLFHDGLFPSSSVSYFNGFWAWDSWKHSAALIFFNEELAKDQIRAMFDHQTENGMIPDCIYSDSKENNLLNTKPPLASWAVDEIYKATQDTLFIEELFPKLVSYHNWWYKERDIDNNGLCEYGATDNHLIGGKWESGMDNAVRFDSSKLLKKAEGIYSLDQESSDLNSFLYQEKRILAKFAGLLRLKKDSIIYISEAGSLKEKINKIFYDPDTKYFYDRNITTGKLIKKQGSEGWIPLFSEACDKEKAKYIIATMTDTSKFGTYIPFPTLSKAEPEFSLGYWRGTVWLDQIQFALKGMRNYGYNDLADKYSYLVFERLEGIMNSDKSIRENYNPIDGKGLRANNFSWSAAALLRIYSDLRISR